MGLVELGADCNMVEEEKVRFHGLPPLKRFKILEKERVGLKGSEETAVRRRTTEEVNLQKENELGPSQGVKVCCLPAKKRVWALQTFTGMPDAEELEAHDDEGQQENRTESVAKKKKKREAASSFMARALQPIDSNRQIPVSFKLDEKCLEVKKTRESSCVVTRAPISNCQVLVSIDPAVKGPAGKQHDNEVKLAREALQPAASNRHMSFTVEEGPTEKDAGIDLQENCAVDEGEEESDSEDDGVFCDVCKEADAEPSDPIVFCDGCNVMVHASCYGSPLIDGIPAGDWFCRQCESESRRKKVEENSRGSHVGFHAGQRTSPSRVCCLCPSRKGAMKRTTGGTWAHLSCALFVPEVFYKRARDREGIECSSVPAWRWEMPCVVCMTRGHGSCIQCTEVGCSSTFHVSCALDAGLMIDYRNANSLTKTPAIVIAFCPSHSSQALTRSERRRFKIVPRG